MNFFTMVIVALLLLATSATANSGSANEIRMAVSTHGFNVGDIVSRYSRKDEGGQELLHYTSHTRINANFLVVSYALESDEEALIGPEGTRSYKKRWLENGLRHQVEAKIQGGAFSCVSTGSDNAVRTLNIPRDSYDYTIMDCPELHIPHEGDTLTVRLLDMETCEVVTRNYHWVRSERFKVNGVTDLYRVIDFRDRNKTGTRWILPDALGAKIARQDGTSAKGTYSVRAVDAGR